MIIGVIIYIVVGIFMFVMRRWIDNFEVINRDINVLSILVEVVYDIIL